MITFVSLLIISSIFNVQSATTRSPDVKSIVNPPMNYQPDVNNAASETAIVGESLASPADTKQFAPVPEGVIMEPVPISDNNDTTQIEEGIPILIRDDNLMIKPNEKDTKIQILIRDDNLMIKPKEEDVPDHPLLIRDDNLMIKPEEEVVPEPILVKDDNLTTVSNNTEDDNGKDSVSVIQHTSNNSKTEHITPTTPTPSSSSVTGDHSFEYVIKPCPDYESRYENGQFIVTLDDGKCEMIVSENIISQNQRNQWASGRYTPIYQLLSRQYKPNVTFRQTSLASEGHNCVHRTRKTGQFFVVDTVVGRCQMVIGIPTLPDLRFALQNTNMANPSWKRPMRRMPTWPRKSSSSSTGSDSED